MKILFMGTPGFAAGILSAIVERSRHEVTAVVTQPDRPKGRSARLAASPVKEYAKSHGIKVLQPERIKTEEETAALYDIDADIYVVAAFGQILSKEILSIPKKGCINVHASLLPEYRGAAPIHRAIADGKEYTGVTIQQMNEGIDTGDIITSVTVKIADDETGESLFNKLMLAGEDLIIKTLDLIEEGKDTHTPQDESKASYAKIMTKETGLVDFEKSAVSIERLCRALTPWPGTYTFLDGRMIKIKECKVGPSDTDRHPGEITDVTGDGIEVSCGEGTIVITSLQAEGKRQMSAHDFLLGNKLSAGMRFGRL